MSWKATADTLQPIITAANCGTLVQTIKLDGTWRDLLTDTLLEGTINIKPSERLLLEKI